MIIPIIGSFIQEQCEEIHGPVRQILKVFTSLQQVLLCTVIQVIIVDSAFGDICEKIDRFKGLYQETAEWMTLKLKKCKSEYPKLSFELGNGHS